MNQRIKILLIVCCIAAIGTILLTSCDNPTEPYLASIAVEATCEHEGVEVWAIGNGQFENRTVAALGHQFDNGTIAAAPTCTATGLMQFTCTRCGIAYTNKIGKVEHTVVELEQVAPTCEEDGKRGGSFCTVCQLTITSPDVVLALGHTFVTASDTPATCAAEGITVFSCQKCPKTSVIKTPMTAHNYTIEEVIVSPSCIVDGVKTIICAGCGNQKTEVIQATGHATCTDAAVSPTCISVGYTAGAHCATCNYVFTPITEIPKLEHDYVQSRYEAPTCTATGLKEFTCTRCDTSYIDSIDLIAHIPQVIEAVAPSCVKDGYSAGIYCVTCHTVIQIPILIPATGHATCTDAAVSPTCISVGYTEGAHCETCNIVLTPILEIPQLDHDYALSKYVAPTCTATGLKEFTCTRCGTSYTNNIEKIAHDVCVIQAVSPTCLEEGRSDGTYCAGCQTVFTASVTIPALGHDFVTETDVPATCVTEGQIVYSCQRCHTTDVQKTPLAQHTYSIEKIIVPPKCLQAGEKAIICAGCGDQKTEVMQATGHTTCTDTAVSPTCISIGYTAGAHCETCHIVLTERKELPLIAHNYVQSNYVTPTCTTNGAVTTICTMCKDSHTTPLEALGHDYGLGIVMIKSTCTTQGKRQYKCSRCADTYTEKLALKDHSYNTTVVAATGSRRGYSKHVCAGCGKSYVDTYTYGETAEMLYSTKISELTNRLFLISNDSSRYPIRTAEYLTYAHNYISSLSKASWSSVAQSIISSGVSGTSDPTYEQQIEQYIQNKYITPAISKFDALYKTYVTDLLNQ